MTDIPGALHGACTRAQADTALGRYGVRKAIAAGVLAPLWPRVLVDGKRLLDPRTRAAAAMLTAGRGAVLCGQTAAWLHGCSAARTSVVHVLVPCNRWIRPQRGLQVHTGHTDADDIVEVDGLPVLDLDLVVSELLCNDARPDALACADQAVALRSEPERAGFLAAVERRVDARRDRRGTRRAGVLLELVNERTESPAESRLRLVVVDAGFPVPDVQHPILDLDGQLVYRLDLAWPQLRIALEYDGYAAHVDRVAQDAARDDDLRRRGWLTVRATAVDLRDPRRLLNELSSAFRSRRTPVTVQLPVAS